ncbi:MAG: cobalt transporter, inner rane subunit CbiQ [Ilumatobacteraceae bacterium]|nr:cobalt transporter, inner rane subunit CbiQ [Ilumatobacteraceae bacterium]
MTTEPTTTSAPPRTPGWLLQRDVALCPCACIGKRGRTNFIDKTILGASGVMRQALFTDDIAAQPGLLQRLDPRVKAVTMLAVVVTTAVLRNIPVLLGLYAIALLLAVASKFSIAYFVKRVWLFIPIFTGIVVLPATFSFITPGHIAVSLGHWFGHRVGLTSQGLRSAGLIVVRVATSISFVVLVALTTTWTRLLSALRALLLPKMFVLVLGMAYRYVFHLLGSVTDMYEARKSRTVRTGGSVAGGRAFVAATAGTVFGTAHELSDEVHQAMVSRGYTGHPRTLTAFRVRSIDVCWTVACTVAIVVTIGVDRAVGR